MTRLEEAVEGCEGVGEAGGGCLRVCETGEAGEAGEVSAEIRGVWFLCRG